MFMFVWCICPFGLRFLDLVSTSFQLEIEIEIEAEHIFPHHFKLNGFMWLILVYRLFVYLILLNIQSCCELTY